MKKFKKFISLLAKKNSGIALLMVMASITLLTVLLGEFTFDTKINKIKVRNLNDRVQARLTAEAGLNLAMAKLLIYQKAINLLEKNKSMREYMKPSEVEAIIKQPFIFPIPSVKGLSIIEKKIIEEFTKNVHVGGELLVNINGVNGFINPNNLRVRRKINEIPGAKPQENEEEDENGQPVNKTVSQLTEEELLNILKDSLEEKKEKDETFEAIYGSVEPELLIKELAYYVSDPREMDESVKSEVDGKFVEANITPKHAPLTTIEELYLLPSWNDELVDLIKDRINVHNVTIIHLNEMTNKQLKLLFPEITPEQSEDFFKYRDGFPEENINPSPFKSEVEFKEYIVGNLRILDQSAYDKRIQQLKNAGLALGTSGKLFKIVSQGKYNDTTYALTAFVDLPIKPLPPPKKKKNPENVTNDEEAPVVNNEEEEKKKKEPPPRELLKPRIVEIIIG